MRAMILAAGRGERMRPLTDTCPKPLLRAGGKPLIVWHIERLRDAGISEIVINHAHLGHMIESELGDGNELGVRLQYSAEALALETAGGIRQALPRLGSAPFLVINGDISCDADLATFCRKEATLSADGDLAHLLMVANPSHHQQGDFCLRDGRLHEAGGERFTFSGIGLYHPALFADVPAGVPVKLGPLLRKAMATEQISGALHDGYWLDVGTPQRLAELDEHLKHKQP